MSDLSDGSLDGALCAGVTEPLWDSHVDGEDATGRAIRQARGIAECRKCPVLIPCRKAVDPERDDGVRGGEVLKPLNGSRSFGGYGAVQGTVRAASGSKRKSA